MASAANTCSATEEVIFLGSGWATSALHSQSSRNTNDSPRSPRAQAPAARCSTGPVSPSGQNLLFPSLSESSVPPTPHTSLQPPTGSLTVAPCESGSLRGWKWFIGNVPSTPILRPINRIALLFFSLQRAYWLDLSIPINDRIVCTRLTLSITTVSSG